MVVNLQPGEAQPLQLLDAEGKELSSSSWSVDSPELAEIKEEGGHAVLHSKAAGVVRVQAMHEGKVLSEEIRIWDLAPGMFLTGPHWVVPSTGRELGALQSVPTVDGPDLFTLDQTDQGASVRGLTNRGIQLWILTLPKPGGKLELVCGDNLGGALLTVTFRDSYVVYDVGKDGKTLWRHKFEGVRKGYAVNASNILHLINQSVDGASATIVGLDGATGVEKFKLTVPPSLEHAVNLERSGDRIVCAPGRSTARSLPAETSGLFVNTDGDAYAAFTQKHWTLGTDKCTAGSAIDPQKIYFSREDRIVLWRIEPEGTHHEIVVDTSKQDRAPFVAPMNVVSPTGDIIPDGFGGVLISMRSSPREASPKAGRDSADFVYRVTEDGELAYKFALPKYEGALHDEMVLGEQELGFATRGRILIAFNVREGNEVWRWNSGAPDLKINMATAGGGCAVETPEGMVLVEQGAKKQVLAPHDSDLYGLGLFIQNDPHGLAMLGAGIQQK